MCRLTKVSTSLTASTTTTPTRSSPPPSSSSSSVWQAIKSSITEPLKYYNDTTYWPLPLPVAIPLLLICLPTSCYVNRGFTQWFHWTSILYWMTYSEFIEKFQFVSGVSICCGWYASLIFEFIQSNRFCHPLYKNMPTILLQYMIKKNETEDNQTMTSPSSSKSTSFAELSSTLVLDFESFTSRFAMATAHLLDIFAHPLLTYYFWKQFMKRRLRKQPNDYLTTSIFYDILSPWYIIIAAYTYSRIWSLFHTKYNTGIYQLWYIGYDVYIIDNLESWYPAYIMETIIYLYACTYKLYYNYRLYKTKNKNEMSISDLKKRN